MAYPAKLLLLGEYTVINSSHALARPFDNFAGQWAWRDGPNDILLPFADYLQRNAEAGEVRVPLDLRAFEQDLHEGLHFASDIRSGYGLGSSGALCAAVYDRYGREKIGREDRARYRRLKEELAVLESYFHGSSSGADPLVSYLDQPLLLLHSGNAESVFLPKPEPPHTLFLLDTGTERQTGPLVQHYLEQCRQDRFANAMTSRLAPANNAAIQAWLAGDMPALFQRWAEISALQYRYFIRMIPSGLEALWEDSLHQDAYALKLCGAGGGGYLLGMTDDWYLTQKRLSAWPLIRL